MIDWSRCRTTPFEHQKAGVEALLRNRAFALFDQVGAGKSKQVVDAACFLYGAQNHAARIEAVVVVAPASVRSVWADPDPVLGEVAKHAWPDVPIRITEYSAKATKKGLPVLDDKHLNVVVTNYELLRREERLNFLLVFAKLHKTMLVLDESWMIQNPRAHQTKAMRKLTETCTRVVLLNGTPGDPKAVYSQFWVMDPKILGFKNEFAFRNAHAVMGGYMNKKIVDWQHMEEFQAKVAPYALRRLTHECVDLPPVSYTQIDARLTPTTWTHYVAMRDELVTWLSQNEVCTAEQAGVRVMRLAQITNGFLGGVRETELNLLTDDITVPASSLREIGREKLDALLEWLGQHPPEGDKAVVWGRFRPEIERTARVLQEAYPQSQVRKLYGGQSQEERNEIKQLLAPGGNPAASIVVGSPQAGGSGLNFAASSVAIYLSNGFSLKDRLQSEGRLDRPGQTRPVVVLDIVACGPNNERTLDHLIVAALRRKEDLSNLTASAWRNALVNEG